MHYQHTLKFASKSYFHNFRVNHTQDQSLSDNTHDFNDKIHVKPIDKNTPAITVTCLCQFKNAPLFYN